MHKHKKLALLLSLLLLTLPIEAEVVNTTALTTVSNSITSNNTFTGTNAFTQPVIFPNGSAAAPSLAFASDTTVGWFRGTASSWGWAASAAERLRITSVSGGAQIITGNSTGQSGGYWIGSTGTVGEVHWGRISGGTAGFFGGSATKTLTESAATSFVQMAVAASSDIAGSLHYVVLASDATPNRQALSGELRFSAVNIASTETCPAPTDIGTALLAANTGTLSCTWTCDTAAADAVTLQANCVSSLTQTSLTIRYSQIVCLASGGGDCGIITAQ